MWTSGIFAWWYIHLSDAAVTNDFTKILILLETIKLLSVSRPEQSLKSALFSVCKWKVAFVQSLYVQCS